MVSDRGIIVAIEETRLQVPNQTGSGVPGAGQDVNAPDNDNMNGSNGNFPNRQMPNDMEMPNGRNFGGNGGGGMGRNVWYRGERSSASVPD